MPETEPKRMPFSPALVPKVLDGTKTVTRRCHRTPRYKVGDIICISERWQHEDTSCDDPQCGNPYHIYYHATDPAPETVARWRPSILQPVWACRPWRGRIIDVRQERLWNIDDEDAEREGVEPGNAAVYFRELWNSINGRRQGYAWKDNPQVIRYEWEPVNV